MARSKSAQHAHKFNGYDQTALVLQGGGALGAYQAGVFAALAASGVQPDWVAGVSIGAINAAIIAGNPPQRRVERLKEFWERVSQRSAAAPTALFRLMRHCHNVAHAFSTAVLGIPGFFRPHPLAPAFAVPGSANALSNYDTTPLVATLEELVDFDYLNAGHVRLSLGAVNVRSGESVYFDNTRITITPDHVRASGALPPSFPPVEIDGEFYWDGGILSNTPLSYLLDQGARKSTIIYQIDLFSGAGDMPTNLEEVKERSYDIQYASRRLFGINQFRRLLENHLHLSRLLEKLPTSLQSDPDVEKLRASLRREPLALVRLVNRTDTESRSVKCYDFSAATVGDLWAAGTHDLEELHADPARFQVLELGALLRLYENSFSEVSQQLASEIHLLKD